MKYKAKPYEELDGTGYVVDDEGHQLTGVMAWDEAEALAAEWNRQYQDPELAFIKLDQLVKDVGTAIGATKIEVADRFQQGMYSVDMSNSQGFILKATMSPRGNTLLLNGYNDYVVNLINRDPRFKVLVVHVWDGPDYYVSYAKETKQ